MSGELVAHGASGEHHRVRTLDALAREWDPGRPTALDDDRCHVDAFAQLHAAAFSRARESLEEERRVHRRRFRMEDRSDRAGAERRLAPREDHHASAAAS